MVCSYTALRSIRDHSIRRAAEEERPPGEVIEVGVRERRSARRPRSRGSASASLTWTARSGLAGVLLTGPWAIDHGSAVSLSLAGDKAITLPGLLACSVHNQSVAHEKPPARQAWGCRVQQHGASSRATATGLCNRRREDTGLCTGLQGGDPGPRPPSNRVAGRVIALATSYSPLGVAPAARRRRGRLRTRYQALLVRRGSLQAVCLGAARDEAPRTHGLGRGIVDPSCPRERGIFVG